MTSRINLGRRFSMLVIMLVGATLATGCSPKQPFYFFEDGDLSHYVGMATNIDYPDVDTCSLQEVCDPPPPLTLSNPNFDETFDLSLEDAVRIALENGKVMRSLGARLFITPNNARTQIGGTPSVLQDQSAGALTVYDPAITESDPIFGPEGALAVYDAQFTSSMIWNKNDQPRNLSPIAAGIFNRVFQQDLGTFQNAITKRTATGGEFSFSNGLIYDNNNNPTRQTASDWNVNFDAGFRQPLLQGAGSLYNRIAGPFDPLRGIGTYLQWDGVVIARIRTDIRLADFEAGVRDFVSDVENAYWELYFAYRNLDARKTGLESARQTWMRVNALAREDAKGGEADKEAQSREQYYFFRGEVETAQNDLFRAENRLRYMMGLSASDGRLIRPIDEPTDARVVFDWCEIHAEGLARSVDLRQQKWRIKQRELELIASKNLLLPRLDVVGRYRWLGLGQDLIDYPGDPYNAADPFDTIAGTDAFSTLASGRYQESEYGLQFSMPIGFRRELAAVRNQQLLLARERAILQDQELELQHGLAEAIRDLDTNYRLAQTNFNRRVAAQRQVEAVQAAYDAGTVTLDLLLEAQRRRADAEAAYYRSITDYNKAIMLVHFRKGSLLEYNGVYLAEGPWPAKAYFDATRRARARDAGLYLDYGYTRPSVFSQGAFPQFQNTADGTTGGQTGEPTMATPEEIAPPSPERATPPANEIPDQRIEPIPATPGPASVGHGPSLVSADGRAPAPYGNAKPNAAKPGQRASRPMMDRNVRPTSATQPVQEETFDWGDLSLEPKASPAGQNGASNSSHGNSNNQQWKSTEAAAASAGSSSDWNPTWKASQR